MPQFLGLVFRYCLILNPNKVQEGRGCTKKQTSATQLGELNLHLNQGKKTVVAQKHNTAIKTHAILNVVAASTKKIQLASVFYSGKQMFHGAIRMYPYKTVPVSLKPIGWTSQNNILPGFTHGGGERLRFICSFLKSIHFSSLHS